MPVYTFCIGQSEPINWDDLRPHVHKVLKDRNIAWESISLFRRRHTARETNYKDLTVLITARKEDNDNWALAIYDLRRFFISQGQPDLVIEFLDERARRKTYPIRSSDPVNLIWPELRRQILVRLEGQDWVTMSLLRRGSGNGAAENPPTVLLGIKGRYDPSSEVTKDIEALCKRADPEVQLEVLEEADLWEPLDEPLPLPYRAFGDAAPMGSSVGVSGSLGTATLGGRILLRSRIDGDVVNVGITSFNLVKEHLAAVTDTGLKAPDKQVRLVVPSDDDHQCVIQQVIRMLAQDDSRVRNAQEKVEAGGESSHNTSRLEKAIKDRDARKAELERLKAFDRDCGHLFAASGLRDSESGFPLDWALVRLPERRYTPNKLPSRTDPHFSSSYSPHGTHVSSWSVEELRVDREVFKQGRNTDWTGGKIKAWKTDINMGGRTLNAWLAAPLSGSSIFCQKGDAGAMVLDMEGAWCGLLCGEVAGCGLIVPSDVVISDIEAVTGCTVADPEAYEDI